jgi:non-specific serine/threonine protein kinase/serine/threonine-protein kinase
LRSIREDDAPRPSTKLGTLGADSTEIANKRRTEPRTLTRELRGDLDSITLKCIEKDRNRRYGAPADIAADIGRYLRNEPVTAAPAGVAYRAQKFVARHRLGVAAATTIILLAVAFAIAEAVQLRRITRERDRSDRVAQFMRDMFLVSEPFYATRGTNIPASEILDKASREIDLEIKDDSELRARLLRDLGIVYSNLGFDSRAKELLRRAVDLDTGALGPKHRETLRSATALASVMANAPNSNTAENMLRGALAAQESQFGRNDQDTLYTMEALARDLLIHKRLGEAEQFGREALDRSGRVFGRDDRRTWSARWRLFNVLSAERKEAEAAQFGQESLDDAARLFGKDDPQTLTCARLVGRLFMRQQKYAQAEAAARQAVEIDRKSSSTDFLRFGDAAMLASALSNQGKYAEAKQITEDLLSQERAASGDTNSDVAVAMYNLACYSARLGHSEEALSWLKQSVAHGLPPIGLAQMQKDPDLESLRQDARFAALVKAAGAP